MKELPHRYSVKIEGEPESFLNAYAENLPKLMVAPPMEFDGPGDRWSPEQLLMASISSCFVLSFAAIARASKLQWLAIECETSGELDKVDRKIQFTAVSTKAKLTIASLQDRDNAERLLNKAEHTCFVTNSLACPSQLECEILIAGE